MVYIIQCPKNVLIIKAKNFKTYIAHWMRENDTSTYDYGYILFKLLWTFLHFVGKYSFLL